MAYLLAAGLALSAAGAALDLSVDHRTHVDHHSGPVAVTYRGDVVVDQKQVGAVAPGGRQSSLRCVWQARLNVDRHAVATSGASLRRNMDSLPVVSGTRPGWCSTNQAAITKEVSTKTAELKRHLEAVAQQDHESLRAELDQSHNNRQAG